MRHAKDGRANQAEPRERLLPAMATGRLNNRGWLAGFGGEHHSGETQSTGGTGEGTKSSL